MRPPPFRVAVRRYLHRTLAGRGILQAPSLESRVRAGYLTGQRVTREAPSHCQQGRQSSHCPEHTGHTGRDPERARLARVSSGHGPAPGQRPFPRLPAAYALLVELVPGDARVYFFIIVATNTRSDLYSHTFSHFLCNTISFGGAVVRVRVIIDMVVPRRRIRRSRACVAGSACGTPLAWIREWWHPRKSAASASTEMPAWETAAFAPGRGAPPVSAPAGSAG